MATYCLLAAWMMVLICLVQAGDYIGRNDQSQICMHSKNFDLKCNDCTSSQNWYANCRNMTVRVNLNISKIFDSLLERHNQMDSNDFTPQRSRREPQILPEHRSARSEKELPDDDLKNLDDDMENLDDDMENLGDDLGNLSVDLENLDRELVEKKPMAVTNLSIECELCKVNSENYVNDGHLMLDINVYMSSINFFKQLQKLREMISGNSIGTFRKLQKWISEHVHDVQATQQTDGGLKCTKGWETTLTVRNQIIQCNNCTVFTLSRLNNGNLTIKHTIQLEQSKRITTFLKELHKLLKFFGLPGTDANHGKTTNEIEVSIQCSNCAVLYTSAVNNGDMILLLNATYGEFKPLTQQLTKTLDSLSPDENQKGPRVLKHILVVPENGKIDKPKSKKITCKNCVVLVTSFVNNGNIRRSSNK